MGPNFRRTANVLVFQIAIILKCRETVDVLSLALAKARASDIAQIGAGVSAAEAAAATAQMAAALAEDSVTESFSSGPRSNDSSLNEGSGNDKNVNVSENCNGNEQVLFSHSTQSTIALDVFNSVENEGATVTSDDEYKDESDFEPGEERVEQIQASNVIVRTSVQLVRRNKPLKAFTLPERVKVIDYAK